MKKIIHLSLILFLISSICFAKKKSAVLYKDPYTIEDINKLETSFQSGKEQALETLIEISKDKNQILNVRIAALNILSSSQHPMLKTALNEIISETEFVELEIMSKTIEMLLSFEDLESTESLITALKNSENKIMDFRTDLVEAIGENNTENKVLTLLELYEISISNHHRMNELLTLTLGEIDDDRGIPILMDIARNENVDAKVRNRAVEILSRKEAPELIDFFVELIGSPNSNDAILDYVHNTMNLESKDRMVMALLESYQAGKTRYHAVLYSIMEGLKDYKNPQIKPLFVEVAKTEGYPRLLRIKAMQSLSHFNDVTVLDELIPLLNESYNYDYYYEINT